MGFLKKRPIALILTLIIVLSSSVISIQTKFENKCLEAVDGFYDGELYGGITETAIADYLSDICNLSNSIIDMAKSYDIDTTDVEWNVEDIQFTMLDWYDDISYMHYCYEELLVSVSELNKQLSQMPLTADEQQKLSTLTWKISQASSAIDSSKYNESVRLFIREEMKFPTDALTEFAGVYGPDYFQ